MGGKNKNKKKGKKSKNTTNLQQQIVENRLQSDFKKLRHLLFTNYIFLKFDHKKNLPQTKIPLSSLRPSPILSRPPLQQSQPNRLTQTSTLSQMCRQWTRPICLQSHTSPIFKVKPLEQCLTILTHSKGSSITSN